MSELWELTVHEAHEWLARRDISSLELTRSCLERIHNVEPRVKAFVTLTEDMALEQAKQADERIAAGQRDPLLGIPVQIKDLICTRGVRTTCSSRMLESFVPVYDATVVARLFNQGAVLLGKGNMDEFGMGSSTETSAFFPTRNPWSLDRVPGGSSGGAAASVATGEAMYALGSDTGGSIRQPASFCGVVGLKPTYGLVSRYGLIAYASSLDQIGPIAKDVTDCALVLGAIAGYDGNDSTSIANGVTDYGSALVQGIQGLRIGVPQQYFVAGMQGEVKETLLKAGSVLEGLGATLDAVSLPTTPHALACYYIIALSECSANLARYDGVKYGYSFLDAENTVEAMGKTRQHGFGTEVKRRIMLGTYALSTGYYDAYYMKAQQVRTLLRREFEGAFQQFDALLTPTSPTVAFRLGEKTEDPVQMYLSDIYTVPVNLAGLPAISVPCGVAEGLPVGMQLIGPPMSEGTLLRLAYAYEQATQWHLMRPSL